MIKVCIDCSRNGMEWVNGRSVRNPLHTDHCSVCGHRREVIIYGPAQPQDTTERQAQATNCAMDAIAAIEGALRIKELWMPPQYGVSHESNHYHEYQALQKMMRSFESVVRQQHQ